MRRRLDLNGLSTRIVVVIALCLGVIPGALYLASRLLSLAPATRAALQAAGTAFLVAGILLAVGFGILIVVEQIQDRIFDAWYRRNRRRKLRLADGRYECQFCGNRDVSAGDRSCRVCGKQFE